MSKKFFYPVRKANNPYEVELVPISEEVYNAIYPHIWKTRKRLQRSGRCTCPKSMLWMCDADCELCPYRTAGNMVSFDAPLEDAEDLTLGDTISSDEPTPESILMDKAVLDVLYEELDRLDPDGRRICELIMQGKTEREAASLMGISKTAYRYQWLKLKDYLAKRLQGYIK